jgi:environmental stress-induced protein Ves
MNAVARLDPKAYRRTPWKNGGGVTIDIADDYAPGTPPGSWSGMLWRFGRTQIVTPAPFSDLSGFDRILTVIGGRGLWLDIAGGISLDVREPFRPVRFRGEDRIVSPLEAGPVAVLNLQADRTKYEIDVVILSGGEARSLEGTIHLVYALDDSDVIAGESYRLAADEALRLEGEARSLEVARGRVALATVRARSSGT